MNLKMTMELDRVFSTCAVDSLSPKVTHLVALATHLVAQNETGARDALEFARAGGAARRGNLPGRLSFCLYRRPEGPGHLPERDEGREALRRTAGLQLGFERVPLGTHLHHHLPRQENNAPGWTRGLPRSQVRMREGAHRGGEKRGRHRRGTRQVRLSRCLCSGPRSQVHLLGCLRERQALQGLRLLTLFAQRCESKPWSRSAQQGRHH